MTADCFLNGIILSLYHVRTVCEDFNSQAVFAFESKMMGRSSAYAVERWLLYRQHQGFTVSNGEGPDAAFCLGGIVMRQLDQVCESPDSENIQCALDFENTMNNLETQLYYRHLPPKEVALCVMEAACKFYDADWCGLIQVDLDLGLWKPLWWHNECQEDKTTILTNEFESSEFLDRWVKAVRRGTPMVVPDAEEVKDLYPDEYQLYERLGIKSVLAIPLEPRQIALIAVRNPQRYIHQTSMLKLLAYVLLAAYYVTDGQHTIEARILRNGGKDLPILCKIYTGLTMQQEALFFAEQNGHAAPLTAGIKLRAKVVGEDAPSVAFLAATNRVGLDFNYDSLQLSDYRISCVGTALKLYNQMGEKIYCEALRLIVAAWEGKPDSFRASVLRGMMHFVELYHGEFSEERLIRALRSVHPMEIYRSGMDNPAKLPGWKKYVFPIYMAYNGKCRKDALPMKF